MDSWLKRAEQGILGRNYLPAAAYLLLGFPVLLIAPFVFPIFDGLYGQDPYAYFDYATGPLLQSLLTLKPPPPFFWPPGYPLLVALVSLATGPVPLAGQIVSLVAGASVPVFTALLAREIWSREPAGWPVPVFAGVMVAFVGQLWQSSVVVMADTTALAAATIGIWALARYGRSANQGAQPKGFWLVIAAAAISYSILTRWAYALVAIPASIFALVVLARQPRGVRVRHAATAGLVGTFTLLPIIFSVLAPATLPESGTTVFIGNLEVLQWNPLNAFRREFINQDGFLEYRLPNGLYYFLAPAHPFYFTLLLAPLLVAGLSTVLPKRTIAQIILLVGWAGVVYLFLIGVPWQNFRWTLTYLPPLAILAAIGAGALAQRLLGWQRWILSAVVALGLAGMAYGGWTLTQSFIERKNADLETVRWVEEKLPADARLLTFGITLTFQHYSRLETLELFFLNPEEIDGLRKEGRPLYLLLEVSNIETQWAGRSPALNYHWLRDSPGLINLGEHGNFTLFRVRDAQ